MHSSRLQSRSESRRSAFGGHPSSSAGTSARTSSPPAGARTWRLLPQRCRDGHDAALQGHPDQFRLVPQHQLGAGPLHIGVDRGDRDPQPGRDLTVGEALGDEAQYLFLPFGEPRAPAFSREIASSPSCDSETASTRPRDLTSRTASTGDPEPAPKSRTTMSTPASPADRRVSRRSAPFSPITGVAISGSRINSCWTAHRNSGRAPTTPTFRDDGQTRSTTILLHGMSTAESN